MLHFNTSGARVAEKINVFFWCYAIDLERLCACGVDVVVLL